MNILTELGTTRVSNLVHAAFLLMFATVGSPFIARIKLPALAGITAWTGLHLLELHTWKRLHRMSLIDA
jgi:SulP family sulfate permease